MAKKSKYMMSAQEFHDKQFKDRVVRYYERLIRSAEQANDETRLTSINTQLEKIEAGDLSVANNLTFVIDGSKIYYDEKQNRVILDQIPYTTHNSASITSVVFI